jgi:hypothetical protein
LVKEMRLRGIDTVADGNAFLPTFMADYNARFAKAPFDARNADISPLRVGAGLGASTLTDKTGGRSISTGLRPR